MLAEMNHFEKPLPSGKDWPAGKSPMRLPWESTRATSNLEWPGCWHQT